MIDFFKFQLGLQQINLNDLIEKYCSGLLGTVESIDSQKANFYEIHVNRIVHIIDLDNN